MRVQEKTIINPGDAPGATPRAAATHVARIKRRVTRRSTMISAAENAQHRNYTNTIAGTELLTAEEQTVIDEAIVLGKHALDWAVEDHEKAEEYEQDIQAMKAAQEVLVTANLRLVPKFAQRRVGQGLEMDDLIQAGNIGLMEAAEKHDPTKGFEFSTFAARGIKVALRRAIENESRQIRIPAEYHTAISELRIMKAEAEVAGIRLDIDAAAQKVGVSGAICKDLLDRLQENTSLHTPVVEDEGRTIELIDVISGEAGVESELFGSELSYEEADAVLEEVTHASTMRMLYGFSNTGPVEPLSGSAVAASLGIKRQAVDRRKKRALAQLQERVDTENSPDGIAFHPAA